MIPIITPPLKTVLSSRLESVTSSKFKLRSPKLSLREADTAHAPPIVDLKEPEQELKSKAYNGYVVKSAKSARPGAARRTYSAWW
ncbi:hypothetical protein HanIR_Chr17g0867111 [Helianthus annuus]|nr:hypothetical protein HanIR_Chr17g0867111 [Helianthus annuus]